jgi:hypothetical protein
VIFDASTVIVLMLAAALAGALLGVLPEWRRLMSRERAVRGRAALRAVRRPAGMRAAGNPARRLPQRGAVQERRFRNESRSDGLKPAR